MFPIRCPECGQLNYRDDLAFPYCSQCHTDLVRCLLCRHHEGSGCRHPRAYARFTPDGEAAKNCPDFSSQSEVRGSRLLMKLPAPLWVSLLLFLLLASLATAAWFIDPGGRYFRGSPLQVETKVFRQAYEGEPFNVILTVKNPLNRPSTRFCIEIDKDFLANAEWGIPSPRPNRLESIHNKLFFEYDPLLPGERLELELPFILQHEGQTTFSAKIYAPSNQLLWKITSPIEVLRKTSLSLQKGVYL